MSTLCLCLLVGGGTAYAAKHMLPKNSIGTKQIRNNAVTGAKIAKEAITAAKIKNGTLTGAQIDAATLGQVPRAATAASATTATSASTAATAVHADSAATAESAAPQAFAYVEENGSVLASRSRGISAADVARVSNGVYCITVPGFTPLGGQVTPEFFAAEAQSATLNIGGTGFCPAPKVQVVTGKVTTIAGTTTSERASMPFQVELYH
jgi:hypothetical protein